MITKISPVFMINRRGQPAITQYRVTTNVPVGNKNYSESPLVEGQIVYGCIECTYGCVGPEGIAMTHNPFGLYPFFQVDKTVVERVN